MKIKIFLYLDFVLLNMHGEISIVINKILKSRVYKVEGEKKLKKKKRSKILNQKMVREKKNVTSKK